MSLVLADAFYFVARLNRHDQHHERVIAFSREFRSRILTTAWTWGQALQPLRGRVYLPERIRVMMHADGSYDLECGGRVFAGLPDDGAAVRAARQQIQALRQGTESYPLSVTDVLVHDPGTACVRELVAIKIAVEELLNRAG